MDYEKKYKDALEWARKVMQGKVGFVLDEVLEKFPELKEPEDDKIKKALIDFFSKGAKNGAQTNGVCDKDIIAWLGKQGEQKHVVIIPKFRIGDEIKTSNEESLTITKIDGKGYWSEDLFICNFDDADKWELIEQKTADKVEPKDYSSIDPHFFKTTDKVEPKFHKGDWIVSNRYTSKPFCITKICDTYYLVDNDSFIPFEQESDWRLWTIQDAKDGDVLFYKDEISLYRHDIKNCTKQETTFGGFVYYCCYDGKRFVVDSLYSLTEQDKMDIHPATKEQRDQLEKAMADAGYTFDFEKKELKEIEPDEWSEECCINQLIVFCENCMVQDTNAKRCTNFLKSLKDRYTWKPSDEQMEFLKKCIEAYNEVTFPTEVRVLSSLYNDLKKLREE